MIKNIPHKTFWYFGIIVGMFVFITLLLKNTPLLIDEHQHYQTIQDISSWHITSDTFTRNAIAPGYHLIIGALRRMFGISDIFQTRILTTIFSFFTILVFFALSQQRKKEISFIKTLQVVVLPINFIFYFLIYTDIFSLLVLLICFFFLVKKKYFFSGLFALISIFIRQNNLIWIAYFFSYEFLLSFMPISFSSILKFIGDLWVYEFTFVGSVFFILLNHGVTIGAGNQQAQPLGFHTENIFFFLLTYGLLFLPVEIFQLKRFFLLIKKHAWILLFIPVLFILYWYTFKADHFWNSDFFLFFLRNQLLSLMRKSIIIKMIAFIPMILAVFSLFVTKFEEKQQKMYYPFLVIFLGTLWLIEPRYYIIPFSFFLLFRKLETNNIVEYITVLFFMILSLSLFLGEINGLFFL